MSIEVVDIPLTEIDADENFNCRGKIAPIDVVDLAKDITERGLIQPVSVAPIEKNFSTPEAIFVTMGSSVISSGGGLVE